jgi:ribosomal protein L16 Arg81 hydroxylase
MSSSGPRSDTSNTEAPKIDKAGPTFLAELLYPSTAEEWIQEYWGRRPFHIKASDRDRFRRIWSPERFWRAAKDPQTKHLTCFFRDEGNKLATQGIEASIQVSAADAQILFQLGATASLCGIELVDPDVAALATSIRSELSYPGRVETMSWYSPRDVGVFPHLDAQSTLGLQIEGRKLWRLSPRPVLQAPVRYGMRQPNGDVFYRKKANRKAQLGRWEVVEHVPDESLMEILVEPGDVLYVPAGSWHGTQSIDDTPSLGLTFHFHRVAFHDLLTELLTELNVHAEWRQIPPSIEGNSDGKMSKDFQQYVKARLQELREFIDGFEDGDPRLDRAWKKMIVAPSGARPAVSKAALPENGLAPSQRLRRTNYQAVRISVDSEKSGAEVVDVFWGPQHVRFREPSVLPFAKRIPKLDVFEARTVAPEASWETMKSVLQDLVQYGLLETLE